VTSEKLVLAYCIAGQKSEVEPPHSGVEGAPVRWVDSGVLRCLASDFGRRRPDAPVPEMVKEFSQVLQRIFEQTVIIPFRFPTIVEGDEVLRRFMEVRSAEYGEALRRLHNKVQMDVRITLARADQSKSRVQSGKDYLEGRRTRHQQLQSVLSEFRRGSGSLAEAWVQRDRPSGIRAFALVDRDVLDDFVKELGRVPVPAGVSARITGPWPPSEFVEIVETSHE
jgi:Gas vesicle synthesis protein GvpL/GvpF